RPGKRTRRLRRAGRSAARAPGARHHPGEGPDLRAVTAGRSHERPPDCRRPLVSMEQPLASVARAARLLGAAGGCGHGRIVRAVLRLAREAVGTTVVDSDRRQLLRLLEIVEAGLQVGPEAAQLRLIGEHAVQTTHLAGIEPRGEDVNGNATLPAGARLDGNPVQLLDRGIRYGKAAFGEAAAVDEDVATESAGGTEQP